MEKKLISTSPFTAMEPRKAKFCSCCDNFASFDALFEVEMGVLLVEKYCDLCIKHVAGSYGITISL
jgi:hypothetical protein